MRLPDDKLPIFDKFTKLEEQHEYLKMRFENSEKSQKALKKRFENSEISQEKLKMRFANSEISQKELKMRFEKSQKEQEKKLVIKQQKKIDNLWEELKKWIDESQQELNEQFSKEHNKKIKTLQEQFQEQQNKKTEEISKIIEGVKISDEHLRNSLQEFRQSLAKNFMSQLFLLCDEFDKELKLSQNNNNENNQEKIEEAKERLNQRIHLATLILEKNLLETNSTLAKVTKSQKEGFEVLSPVLQKFLEQEAAEKEIQELKQHPKRWAYYINCRRGLESKLFATKSLSSGMVSRPDSKTEKGQQVATGIFNGFLEIFDVFGAAVVTNIIQFAADETTSAAKDYFENKKIKQAEANFEYFEAAIWMIKYTSMHLTNSYSSTIDTQENEKEAGKAGTKSAEIIYDYIKKNRVLGVSPKEKADHLFGVVEKEANTGKTSLFSTKAHGKIFKSGPVKPNRIGLSSPSSKNQLVQLTTETNNIHNELNTRISQHSSRINQVGLQVENQNKQLEKLEKENEELKKKNKELEENQKNQGKEINDLKLLVEQLIKQQKGQQPVNQNTTPSQGSFFK